MKKYLKFLCLTFLFITILLPLKVNTVNASSETYCRILTDNAIIYSDTSMQIPLFIVPKTYYVKVEGVYGEYSRVVYGIESENYPVIVGYMKNTDLTATENIPTSPYFVIKVSTLCSDVLFNDIDLKKAYFNVPVDSFMFYYGEFINSTGETLCYVYYGYKLGYVVKSSLNPFTVTPNVDPITTPEVPSEQLPETEVDDNNDNAPTKLSGETLQIIIIIGLSIICISVVYALFKPSKRTDIPAKNPYYEENDE